MNFSFTEEQEMYRSSIARLVRDHYDIETRRKIVASDLGMSRQNWTEFAELGLLALPFPEKFGGLGGSLLDTLVVMEEFGRGIVVEPYFESVVLTGEFLILAGSESQKSRIIPKVVSGETILATAFAERQSRYDPADVETSAYEDGSGFIINGKKSVVWGGPWADTFVVTARTSGGQRDTAGISLFLVEASVEGVSRRNYRTIDGGRACELGLDDVRVSDDALIGVLDEGLTIVEEVFDRARVGLCAEALGAMKVLNETTVEYAKVRKQFHKPIGKFQAIQHRLVEMLVVLEEAVSATYMAALRIDSKPEQRQKAVSAAKAKVGEAARFIGKNAVPIHGGIGMSDELNVGHYFKRLTMIDISLGDQSYHIGRYAGLSQ